MFQHLFVPVHFFNTFFSRLNFVRLVLQFISICSCCCCCYFGFFIFLTFHHVPSNICHHFTSLFVTTRLVIVRTSFSSSRYVLIGISFNHESFLFSFIFLHLFISISFLIAPKLAENIHNQTLLIGSKFKFFCYLQSSGSRPLHFEWLKDGQILRHYGDKLTSYTISTTEDDTLFSIDKIRLNDTGSYTCLVRNSYGSDSKTISLTVKGIFSFESEFLCVLFFKIKFE